MGKFGWLAGAALVVVVVLLAMQVRRPDFDRAQMSPDLAMEAQLHPGPQIAGVLQRSCYSCHSAQAKIPWYGHVWPTSHLLQSDVRRGRARLDFSNWTNLGPEMSRIRLLDSCRMMRESKMPLWYYRPIHPGSSPKPAEIDAFCSWAQSLPPAG